MRRFAPALATILVLALLVAACGDDGAPPSPGQPSATEPSAAVAEYPVTVERSDGKTVTLDSPPQRIASLSPGATEIFYALGAGPQLVATDLQSDYPPEAANTIKLDAFQPNVEAIVGVEADLIFVASNQDDVVAALDALGETVLYLEVPDTLAGVAVQVRLLGRLTGRIERSEELARDLEAAIEAVREKIGDVETGPRVYHELDNTLFSVGPDSFVGDFYNILKAENIAAGAPSPYPQLTQEEVIARDPEVIILADEAFGETPDTVRARAGWDVISAVRSGRIHGIDPDIVSRPGPRVAQALATLARFIYPERFD